jgi:hypothetical protein
MRSRIELAAAMIVITALVCSVVLADGAGWKCQGTFNCQGANCVPNPVNPDNNQQYSCGLLSPINHPKCFYTGNSNDSCTTVQKNCVMITYYLGGACNNNVAPYCNTDIPAGVPPTYQQEAGCNP